ncbi:hypothetical protein [Corallincola spongiicola]|uniref:LITAF domain-containing protein n=1 Tax=Corallincola spongiicola TaxID=2520508 RepID=A0ABY1WNH9_9GAMM|nr:hypothetical protein [Corallincola spongiicola]TAA45025.1 hypothetical protein EXY25_12515 [Corallincola spongiicola]
MNEVKETTFCSKCSKETQHILVLVRKPTGFENSKRRKLKEFVSGMFAGLAFGPFLASMDSLSRHLICETCGTKQIGE